MVLGSWTAARPGRPLQTACIPSPRALPEDRSVGQDCDNLGCPAVCLCMLHTATNSAFPGVLRGPPCGGSDLLPAPVGKQPPEGQDPGRAPPKASLSVSPRLLGPPGPGAPSPSPFTHTHCSCFVWVFFVSFIVKKYITKFIILTCFSAKYIFVLYLITDV